MIKKNSPIAQILLSISFNSLINGEIRISAELADKLYQLSGIEVETWLDLQAKYDALTKQISNYQRYETKRDVAYKAYIFYFCHF